MNEVTDFLQRHLPEIPVKQVIYTSLWIWGIYYATRVKWSKIEQKFTQKEILWFVKWYGDKWLKKLFGENHFWVANPIYDCPMCMASFHSILLSLYFGVSWSLLLMIPIVCGLNYIISRSFPYSDD